MWLELAKAIDMCRRINVQFWVGGDEGLCPGDCDVISHTARSLLGGAMGSGTGIELYCV